MPASALLILAPIVSLKSSPTCQHQPQFKRHPSDSISTSLWSASLLSHYIIAALRLNRLKRARGELGSLSTMAVALPVQVLPYNAHHYNSVLTLGVAAENFQKICAAIDSALESIGEIFVKHHVQNVLGLILLHQRFSLSASEKLVSTGVVATPWDITSGAKELAEARPSSWRFTSEGIAVYELTHASQVKQLNRRVEQFLSDLALVFEMLDLTDTLGIFAIDDEATITGDKLEFTEGRANITLPFDVSPPGEGSIEAIPQHAARPQNFKETIWSQTLESLFQVRDGVNNAFFSIELCKHWCKLTNFSLSIRRSRQARCLRSM